MPLNPVNATATVAVSDPFQYLFPDSDEEAIVRITQIQVRDKGSSPQRVRVVVAGVPVDGVVDTELILPLLGERPSSESQLSPGYGDVTLGLQTRHHTPMIRRPSASMVVLNWISPFKDGP